MTGRKKQERDALVSKYSLLPARTFLAAYSRFSLLLGPAAPPMRSGRMRKTTSE